MRRDTFVPIKSSFLSCEKDLETILHKLFIENRVYADKLKRLLVINTPDCLDDLENPEYKKKVEEMSISKLIDESYIKMVPDIKFLEFEEVKSYVVISFDNFSPNATNPQFRDCQIHFDILCNPQQYYLGDYRLRPFQIAGYIDGLLNESRLSGIGTLHFAGAKEIVLPSNMSGYTLTYLAIHGSDDLEDEGIKEV